MKHFSLALVILLSQLATTLIAMEAAKPQLSLVGKGIRNKTKLFFTVAVYEAELWTNEKERFQRLAKSDALIALTEMEVVELRLKFLRNVSSATIKDAFIEALKENKVNPSTPNMKTFLEKIAESSSYDEGKTAVITADLKNKTLTYVSPDKKTTVMNVALEDIRAIFSIWLGAPADGGLEALKKELVGAPK
jgi:hypothetical protein